MSQEHVSQSVWSSPNSFGNARYEENSTATAQLFLTEFLKIQQDYVPNVKKSQQSLHVGL